MNKVVFSLLATVFATGAAQAQQAYAGLGISTSDTSSFNGGTADGHRSAGKVFGGYEFTPTWAVEAGYTRLGTTEGQLGPEYGSTKHSSDASRTYLAAKATLPLTQQLSVFGKLGATYSKRDMAVGMSGWSERHTEGYGAVGAQYSITPQVAVVAEYERYGKRPLFGHKADTVTVGARYNF